MTIADGLMILAVLLGPVVAVRLTRYLDDKKEVRGRKLGIFKALMTTRQYRLSQSHVEALNRIELEFDRRVKKEKAVIDAWMEYLDHLSPKNPANDQWAAKRVDLFVEMLHRMAIALNYEFDRVHIKNSNYLPKAHGEFEDQQFALRVALKDILDGKRAIPITIYDQSPIPTTDPK